MKRYFLTAFKNTYDNKTHRIAGFLSWEDFESMLYNMAKREGKKGGKNSSPLISPALYVEGSTRANKNVVKWASWCAVDVDDFSFENSLEEELYNRIGSLYYVCYSTASSKVDNPKFRLVFPLIRDVEAKEIKHFWHSINSELGQLGDKQTKDLSRMYYIPAIYPNAYNFIFTNRGSFVDPDLMMAKHPYKEREGKNFIDRLPPELQKAIIEHRKQSLENTSVSWSNYKDCPFFPKRLAIEYQSLTETGWYHKMYQIMVATAGNAIKNGYPITSKQIADLCRQLDTDTGNWYTNRPLDVEADRAVEYAYRNN